MITKGEILMGRISVNDLSPEQHQNLLMLHGRINKVRMFYGVPMFVSSGYRSSEDNRVAGGATSSLHMVCAAVDIKDSSGDLWQWLMKNLDFIKLHSLWLEDRRWTPTWVHFQIFPPKSGRRIFIPNSKPAPAPHLWHGQYDLKFD